MACTWREGRGGGAGAVSGDWVWAHELGRAAWWWGAGFNLAPLKERAACVASAWLRKAHQAPV
jgi:hypothetical protein